MNNLYRFLGWQGGTVHQLARELNVSVQDLLYKNKPSDCYTGTDYNLGTYWETCSLEHRLSVLLPKYKGNINYWLGVRDRITFE